MAVARSNFTALDHFWKNWRMVFPRCHYAGCASGQAGWRRLLRRHMGVRLRDAWYCTPQCFEMAARQIFTRMANAIDRQNSVTHRIPLALLMLSRGQLTQEQLLSALRAQRSAGRYKIGIGSRNLALPPNSRSLPLWPCSGAVRCSRSVLRLSPVVPGCYQYA